MFTVPTKTKAQTAAEQVEAINAHATASVENARHNYQVAFDLIWSNPESAPQEIFDAMGTEAVRLFLMAGATINYLSAVIPGYSEPQPPYRYTINPNGTVTCGEMIAKEENPPV